MTTVYRIPIPSGVLPANQCQTDDPLTGEFLPPLVRNSHPTTLFKAIELLGAACKAVSIAAILCCAAPAEATPTDTANSGDHADDSASEDVVYTDPAADHVKGTSGMSEEERTNAMHSLSSEEAAAVFRYLYKGRDADGRIVPFTAAERKENAVLYSQACNLAMQKQRETFVRKLALDDPDGNTDSFVTKVVERTWGPTGQPRDWKESNPPRRWITEYKNVTFKVEFEQLTEVQRMNGWRWRGKVRFSAKYKRIFSGTDEAYFGQSTSGRLRPSEWAASRGFLDVSLANRDGKWTVSVSPYETNLEYSKPSEAEMKEYDAAVAGTRSK